LPHHSKLAASNACRSAIGEIASAAAHETSRGATTPERSTLSALTNHSYAPVLYLPRPWVSAQLDCPSVQCALLRLHFQTPKAFAWTLSRA
jgi:hypothetical protein